MGLGGAISGALGQIFLETAFSCPSSLAGEVQIKVEKVPFGLTLHATFPSQLATFSVP